MTVEVVNESGVEVDERALVEVAEHVLASMGVSPVAVLSLSLQDPTEMERLHLQHMGEPGPTDVLSFEMDELDLRGSRGVPQGSGHDDDDAPPPVVGDVVLCPQVAERQALEAGHSTLEELQLLTTHGILHILGFDHATPEEHEEMFGLQGRLLAGFAAASGRGEAADGAHRGEPRQDTGGGGQDERGPDA